VVDDDDDDDMIDLFHRTVFFVCWKGINIMVV